MHYITYQHNHELLCHMASVYHTHPCATGSLAPHLGIFDAVASWIFLL